MTRREYALLDVFTDAKFSGNQLAVFRDGRGIPDATMQAIAKELNLPETVFVLPPADSGDHRLRIFTPARELPFGHHGANHPVKDLRTGHVVITSQNHEFQVDEASIPADSDFVVSARNLNDGSVEGLAHATLPIRTYQYHPEGAPGPRDNEPVFDSFLADVRMAVERR